MTKEQMKKDVKSALEQSVDEIGEATKKSTGNIIEVMAKHGVQTVMEYFDKGLEKIKEKIEEGFSNGSGR